MICCICFSECKDHHFEILKCCQNMIHQKCLFFLAMNNHKKCPLCRESMDLFQYMDKHVIEIHKEETLKEHPEWNPYLAREAKEKMNKRLKLLTTIIAICLYLNFMMFVFLFKNAVRMPPKNAYNIQGDT